MIVQSILISSAYGCPHSSPRRIRHDAAVNSVPDVSSEYCAKLLTHQRLANSRFQEEAHAAFLNKKLRGPQGAWNLVVIGRALRVRGACCQLYARDHGLVM